MVDSKYGIAYSEILEILKYIPVEDYNKIPKEKIELFEANADSNYKFIYDPNKTLSEQNVSSITKGIIILLFRDYWATDTQREKIIAKQNYDRQILEKEKQEKYNPNNIFKNKNQDILEEDIENEVEITKYKESIFKKIINKIKTIFSR